MHIITPYNPWAPKKKKSWQEQQWEEQQIAEIEARMLAEASSRTLPDNAPQTSVATAGGMANAMAGGGGQPPVQFFEPTIETVAFSFSPTSGDGPVTVQFTNNTSTPQFDSYLWEFSDGVTTWTSTDISPTWVFDTGSGDPNNVTVSLQTTNSVTGEPGLRSAYSYIPIGVPTVAALFTFTTSSNDAPAIATFTNASTDSSETPSTIYLWSFGSGSLTSTSANPSPFTYTVAGGYTASLHVTGSYGLTASYTQSFVLA